MAPESPSSLEPGDDSIPSNIQTLTDFEKWLYYDVVMSDDALFNGEYCGIFTPEGRRVKCWYIPGPFPCHPFTQEEDALAQGNIISHNHPSGYPFSFEEIPMAADLNLREFRVITREWVYSIRPRSTDGLWPSPSRIKQENDAITTDTFLPFYITHDDFTPEWTHQRYGILAERAGFEYSREPISF